MPDPLLTAYDAQLRRSAEVTGADDVVEFGPVLWARFGRRGFVTYRDLGGNDVDTLIAATIAYFRDSTDVDAFEWKTRGHDPPADLGERLRSHGFRPGEVETVMAGDVDRLTVPVALPPGVTTRQAGIDGELADDVARASRMQNSAFGGGPSADATLRRILLGDGAVTLWLAEADGEVVSAGRLEIVPGTEFAGLWGGATAAQWRRRGIYRALTAARAQHAQRHGARYLQSDCTEMSRPILERSGLRPITTTTPYLWRRPIG